MAFKEVNDLGTDITISLGGINKKTGKANPKSIEGYYLGRREVTDLKKQSGKSYIYVFQISKGNVGVWGKTDMDRKMESATVGAMTRVTHTHMQDTKNGQMYKYKVEIDADNSVEVLSPQYSSQAAPEEYGDEALEETDVDADEERLDEVPVAYAPPPRQPAAAPSADARSRAAALLKRKVG